MSRLGWTLWFFLLSCAGTPSAAPPLPPPQEKPPITVAIIGFGGTDGQPSAAEDGCVQSVLEGGYRVVERRLVVAALPNENDVDFSTVGQRLAADLIIDGGVVRGSGDGAARLELRMISAHSANVLATAKSKARVRLSRETGQKGCARLLEQLP
jgi:TolB-like protein